MLKEGDAIADRFTGGLAGRVDQVGHEDRMRRSPLSFESPRAGRLVREFQAEKGRSLP